MPKTVFCKAYVKLAWDISACGITRHTIVSKHIVSESDVFVSPSDAWNPIRLWRTIARRHFRRSGWLNILTKVTPGWWRGGGGLLRRRRRMMIILQQLETDYVRRDPTVTNHTHQHTQATLQFKCVVPAVRVVYTAWRCWAQQRVCSGQTRSQGDAFISRRCCRACSEQLLPRQM